MGVVMGIGFLVNILLMLGTCSLSGQRPSAAPMVLGAALGGVYLSACMVPRLYFLRGTGWYFLCVAAMAVIAFGIRRWRVGGIFALLIMTLGGASRAIDADEIWKLLLLAVGVFGLSWECRGRQCVIPVEIQDEEAHVIFSALRDSGNELRDPVTGDRVLVIAAQQAECLTGLTRQQLRAPLETMTGSKIPGLRLIPYCTVGQEDGLLLARCYRRVRVNGRERTMVVAFAPNSLGGDAYQALIGGA